MDTWMVDGDGDGYPAPLADEQKSKRGTNCLPDCQPLLLADKHGLFAMQLFTGPPQTIRTSAGLSGPFLTPRAWKGIRPSSRWTPPQVVRRQISILQKYIEQRCLKYIFKGVFCKYIFSKDNHPSSGWRQSQVGRRRQTTYREDLCNLAVLARWLPQDVPGWKILQGGSLKWFHLFQKTEKHEEEEGAAEI